MKPIIYTSQLPRFSNIFHKTSLRDIKGLYLLGTQMHTKYVSAWTDNKFLNACWNYLKICKIIQGRFQLIENYRMRTLNELN